MRAGGSARWCAKPMAASATGCGFRDERRYTPRASTTSSGAKTGRRLREAIPNPAEVLERARLKSLELEARKAGASLDMVRALEPARSSAAVRLC